MRRQFSVEDLFAPLNRLDVKRHPSAFTEAVGPLPNSRVADAPSPPPPLVDTHHRHQQDAQCRDPVLDLELVSSSTAAKRIGSAFILDTAQIPEETGHGEKSSTAPGLGLPIGCILQESISAGPRMAAGSKDDMYTLKDSSTMNLNYDASVSDVGSMGLQVQGDSTSDDDQQVFDDRKQRRMLSNRESARRSRLRKQQHLDELRGHVAQLRAQNSQMLNNFNLASQQFAQIAEENLKLRSEAMDLSHQLQRLHHTVMSQQTNNGLLHEASARQSVRGPHY